MKARAPKMNLKRINRVYEVADAIASRKFNDRLEMSTTYTLAAMILAMDKAHCKINYEKWFDLFAEIYPELIKDPVPYIQEASRIVDADIEIHFVG